MKFHQFATGKWMELQIAMLSEVSQIQKDMFSLVCGRQIQIQPLTHTHTHTHNLESSSETVCGIFLNLAYFARHNDILPIFL
jgi:hypothetical protein